MANTINLVPVPTREQVIKEVKKFKVDFYSALILLAFVAVAGVLLVVDSIYSVIVNSDKNVISNLKVELSNYSVIAGGMYVAKEKSSFISNIQNNAFNPINFFNFFNQSLPTGAYLQNVDLNGRNFSMYIYSPNITTLSIYIDTLYKNTNISGLTVSSLVYSQNSNQAGYSISGIYEGH